MRHGKLRQRANFVETYRWLQLDAQQIKLAHDREEIAWRKLVGTEVGPQRI
jgi:hypothetical protein